MRNVDDYWALLHADASEAAERTLRWRFGRLSNRRILNILRPVADQIHELRERSDAELLDEWFSVFTVHRSLLQSANSDARRTSPAATSAHIGSSTGAR